MGSVRDYIESQGGMDKTAKLNPLAVILPLIALAGGAYAFKDQLGLGGEEEDAGIKDVLMGKLHAKGEGFKPKPRRSPSGGPKGLGNLISGAFDKPENTGSSIKNILGDSGPKGEAIALARALGLDI